jgi:hypothetical protein
MGNRNMRRGVNNFRILHMDDLTYGSGSSQEKILKVGELKRLINKYSRHCSNPDGILELTIYNSNNDDKSTVRLYLV